MSNFSDWNLTLWFLTICWSRSVVLHRRYRNSCTINVYPAISCFCAFSSWFGLACEKYFFFYCFSGTVSSAEGSSNYLAYSVRSLLISQKSRFLHSKIGFIFLNQSARVYLLIAFPNNYRKRLHNLWVHLPSSFFGLSRSLGPKSRSLTHDTATCTRWCQALYLRGRAATSTDARWSPPESVLYSL